MKQFLLRTNNFSITWRSFLKTLSVLTFGVALLQPAKATTVTFGGLTFNLTSNDPASTAVSSGSMLMLLGPNDGSGNAGATDLTTTAAGSERITFDFLYGSSDIPQADNAGYLVNGSYFQLADTNGEFGTGVQFSVNAGQTFGFRVGSVDDLGEAGVLNVSSFSVTPVTSGAPEPATWSMLLLGGGAAAAVRRRMKRG